MFVDIDSHINDTGFKSAYSEHAFNPQDKELVIDIDKKMEELQQPNPFKEEIENTPAYLRKFIVNTKPKAKDQGTNNELWDLKIRYLYIEKTRFNSLKYSSRGFYNFFWQKPLFY